MQARTLTKANAEELTEWCRGRLVEEQDALDPSVTQPGINVPCGTEVKRASLGDTIIRSYQGVFSISKKR